MTPSHIGLRSSSDAVAGGRSNGLSGTFIVFLVFVLLMGAVGGIYIFRPSLFSRGTAAVATLLGKAPPAKHPELAQGPPFNEASAGVVLGKAAAQSSQCARDGGPTGKGRVKVLYRPTGKASQVMVSEPFEGTPVGQCLVDHFLKTEVPAFGGQPVVVRKTFELR
jgi:hypothetical protein